MTVAYKASELHVLETASSVIIAPQGELDMADAAALRTVLHRLGEQNVPVVIDLAATTFVDSTILGVLLGADRAFRARRVPLVVRNPRASISRVLVLTGVASALTFEESEVEGTGAGMPARAGPFL